MHNKCNVNQPSRSSTINVISLLFCIDHISLRQGHLTLPGARACLLVASADNSNAWALRNCLAPIQFFILFYFIHLPGLPQPGSDHRRAPPWGSLASHPLWKQNKYVVYKQRSVTPTCICLPHCGYLSSSAFIWKASSSQSNSLCVNSLTSCCWTKHIQNYQSQQYLWDTETIKSKYKNQQCLWARKPNQSNQCWACHLLIHTEH